MSNEILDFTIPANATTDQPAISADVDLTLSDTVNSDGSYTVTAASGTYGSLQITSLAPIGTDGSDNEIFLNGSPLVDLGGITFVTDGAPQAATDLGQSTANAADVNFFYTGTSVQPNDAYAVDTAQVSAIPNSSVSVSCFCRGVSIRTPDGDAPVETLKRGDLVMTVEGVAKPISWLGVQTVSAIFSDPVRSWPIRVKSGALGENIPCRDLLLSPDHALLVDGVLIHAGAMVNGTSILRETTIPPIFVYYHVELDDHSLILAENAPAETFIDNVDRLCFDNWAEHEALYPDGKPLAELPYPRARGRRQVAVEIRAALDERARNIGAVETATSA